MDTIKNIFLWIGFYNYFVTILREPIILRVVKNSGTEILPISESSFFFTRGSHRSCSIEKDALKKLAIFTGKPLYQNLILSCNFA